MANFEKRKMGVFHKLEKSFHSLEHEHVELQVFMPFFFPLISFSFFFCGGQLKVLTKGNKCDNSLSVIVD